MKFFYQKDISGYYKEFLFKRLSCSPSAKSANIHTQTHAYLVFIISFFISFPPRLDLFAHFFVQLDVYLK